MFKIINLFFYSNILLKPLKNLTNVSENIDSTFWVVSLSSRNIEGAMVNRNPIFLKKKSETKLRIANTLKKLHFSYQKNIFFLGNKVSQFPASEKILEG